MKRTHTALIVVIFVLLAAAIWFTTSRGGLAAPAETQSTPDQPHYVLGRAKVDGVFVPEGTWVSAWCGGIKVAEEQTIEYMSESWYSVDVPADDPSTSEKNGCINGDMISFKVAGFDADQEPVPWVAGGYTELDLTATSNPLDPHHVAGLVRVNGTFVPAGIEISAWCSGVEAAAGSTDSQAHYSLNVPSDDLSTPNKEGCNEGETIHFKIASLDAIETLAWHGGQTSSLDLSATSQPPEDYQVYGQVRVNDEFVRQGTRISAWCQGVRVAEAVTSIEAYYNIMIPGDNPFTLEIEGCGSGEMINFMIGNLEADQTVNWGTGDSIFELDLSAEGQMYFNLYLPLILK